MNIGVMAGLGNALTSAGQSVDQWQERKRQAAMQALQQALIQSQLESQAQARTLNQSQENRAQQSFGLDQQRIGLAQNQDTREASALQAQQQQQRFGNARQTLIDMPGERAVADDDPLLQLLKGSPSESFARPNQLTTRASADYAQPSAENPTGFTMPTFGAPSVGPRNGAIVEPIRTPQERMAADKLPMEQENQALRMQQLQQTILHQLNQDTTAANNAQNAAQRTADLARYQEDSLAVRRELEQAQNEAKFDARKSAILELAMKQALDEAKGNLSIITDPRAMEKIDARRLEIYRTMMEGAPDAFGGVMKPAISHTSTQPPAQAPTTGSRFTVTQVP